MNDDFQDLLETLLREKVRFLVVGAHAMAVHGVPRATGDLDVWIDPEPANATRAWQALTLFGAPLSAIGISLSDLETPGTVVQIGVPPRRIDLLTSISGADFADSWAGRSVHVTRGIEVPFLGRKGLVANKRATGRSKDLADLEALGE